MAQAEIQYVVTDAPHHQDDVEEILAAIGAYENEAHHAVVQTAEISEQANDTVVVKLVRTVDNVTRYGAVQNIAEKMRSGVESHFSDADKERLSQHFAGIAISGGLEND